MLLRAELTESLLAAAFEVHTALGPGLLENAYESCLAHELSLRGIPFRRQVPIPLEYKGAKVDCAFKADLVVDEAVILELKSVERLHPIHEAQLLTYLRLTKIRVGLVINFNTRLLKEAGILRRVV